MSYFLTTQASQFLLAMCAGMFLSAVYDVIIIFRNVIKHNSFWLNVEDFLYWNFVGIFLYIVIFISNDGILRWFIIASAFLGAYLFHASIGRFVVKYSSIAIKFIINTVLKKPIKKVTIVILKILKKPFRFLKGLIKKPLVCIKSRFKTKKTRQKGEVNGKKSQKKHKIK
ncbi:MAG: spore cortex biosynthesis protein YabQ [Lachnospiraceae bacterium]|nr:spore cortex biosynthesis protein YabQ [Lachnospiraceae bacterium]